MTYPDYKAAIQRHLQSHPGGVTWQELRAALKLPYQRPCPEWTLRLEREIGLVRKKGSGPGLRWTLAVLSDPA